MQRKKIPVTIAAYKTVLNKKEQLEKTIEAIQDEMASSEEGSDGSDHKITEARLIDLKRTLKMIRVVQPEQQNEKIRIGNIATIKFLDTTKEVEIILDGVDYAFRQKTNQTQVEQKICSLESPLGKELFDKRVGDVIKINNRSVRVMAIFLPKA